MKMNRADIKRIKKMSVPEIAELLDVIEKDAISRTLNYAVEAIYSSAAVALRDEFEFGHGRVVRFMKRLEGKVLAITNKDVTIEDMKQVCKEELNITVDGNWEEEDIPTDGEEQPSN